MNSLHHLGDSQFPASAWALQHFLLARHHTRRECGSHLAVSGWRMTVLFFFHFFVPACVAWSPHILECTCYNIRLWSCTSVLDRCIILIAQCFTEDGCFTNPARPTTGISWTLLSSFESFLNRAIYILIRSRDCSSWLRLSGFATRGWYRWRASRQSKTR